jgi:hypothetical protein
VSIKPQEEQQVKLTDEEYQAALKELAEFDRAIAEADRLSEVGTLEKAAVLDKLFKDERWIVERNAERIVTAKTPAGGRPVDPTSKSQFSTWVRGRFNHIDPRRTYQLLDAKALLDSYLNQVQITPTSERVLRPLKKLTKQAYGGGSRILPIWEIACRIASENGYTNPTSQDVKAAEAEWKREHIPATQARKEDAMARAERMRVCLISDWQSFIKIATKEQINAVIDAISEDIDRIEKNGHA